MPKITFKPSNGGIDVPSNTKILVAATKLKEDIRFGCASCRCGTCAVKVEGQLSEMKEQEELLLKRMGLPCDGSVRLSCQARSTSEDVIVDLAFQDLYSPDTGLY